MAQNDTNPPPWQRAVVGFLGASAVVAGPIWSRIAQSIQTSIPEESVQPVGTGMVIALAFTWALAIFLTTVMREDHIIKCLLTSLGLPGLVVAAAVGFQSVQ